MRTIKELVKIIKNGGVVVIPTDTVKGISADAFNHRAVEKVYQIKKRPQDKPFILLINDFGELPLLGIELTSKEEKKLKELWPGKITVILKITNKKIGKALHYLHRGKESLAVRMPKDKFLNKLLKSTGPLISTSANLAGEQAVLNLKKIFGNKIDYYYPSIEGKYKKDNRPSKIIKIIQGEEIVLRN